MLTQKKRKFAQAMFEGQDLTRSALAAGYSPKTARTLGSRLSKDADVLAELKRLEKAKTIETTPGAKAQIMKDMAQQDTDPKAFLESVMLNDTLDDKLRLEAAKTLMPYVHSRAGEQGKKEQQARAARDVTGGRFAQAPAPKSVRTLN